MGIAGQIASLGLHVLASAAEVGGVDAAGQLLKDPSG